MHSAPQATPSGEQIAWAGLPINLDFAFSRKQRDKVYVQHLMRKRESQLSGWSRTRNQQCSCDSSLLNPDLQADAS